MRAGDPSRFRWRRLGRPRYAGALTPRQQDVFELLVTGLTNEEIARRLGITEDGVKYHVSGILRRLDVESRHDAVALHLRTESKGWLVASAPVMFLRKLPFAWLSKAAAGVALTAATVGIALLAWGVMSTSSVAVTTTGCSVEQAVGDASDCAPGVAPAAAGADAITAISAGEGHTCALKVGAVWCWGQNDFGQLGNYTVVRGVPVAVSGLASGVSAISAGQINTCALKDGGVWCWGFTSDNSSNSTPPVAVSGLASGVSAISTGKDHTCALKDDGGVWCWVSVDDSPVPVAVSALERGVTTISAGWAISCALKDGGAWCWGSNWAGRLGNDNATDSPVPVAVSGLASGVGAISAGWGWSHTCAVKDGGVWCWGDNTNGQLGNDSTTDSPVPVAVPGLASGVSAISAGGHHSCALRADGVWCWGRNGAGQLGNNSATDSPVPVPVPGLASGVSAISAAADHSCALKEGGVWCWGDDSNGQLGNNSTPGYSLVPVPVLFTPPSAGDAAAEADGNALPSQTSTDSADHRTAYVLAGTAAAALAILAAGGWAVRRRRRIA